MLYEKVAQFATDIGTSETFLGCMAGYLSCLSPKKQ